MKIFGSTSMVSVAKAVDKLDIAIWRSAVTLLDGEPAISLAEFQV